MQQVFSISQINDYIRDKLDKDDLLLQVAVRGEISNYKMYPSGHHYFTLKDEASTLKCVMFKGNAMRLRFRPENGMQIIALGRISVYPRDSVYQLYCTAMTIDGVGDLYAAFEQLKARLGAKGLFDAEHKKPIPLFPKTIGIVTSSAGAAVHDMIRILRKRFPLVQVKLLPVRVQGIEAPEEIAEAIRFANRYRLADLLIVGRGGGSIEDLWAFNDERVAYAIYDSEIPIISAVGHEPDVTISDYVADVRAATPSNAAELAVPDQQILTQSLDAYFATIASIMNRQIRTEWKRLEALSISAVLKSPTALLEQKRMALSALNQRLIHAEKNIIGVHSNRYVANVAKLDAMSPLKVLARGYAVVRDEKNNVVRWASSVKEGTEICVTLQDGNLKATVNNKEVQNGQEE